MAREYTTIGEAIKLHRERHNLTRGHLADALGIKYSTISNYENDVREPDIKTLQKIVEFFNSTLDDFLLCDPIKFNVSEYIKGEPVDEKEAMEVINKFAKIKLGRDRQLVLEILNMCSQYDTVRLKYAHDVIRLFMGGKIE